MLATQRQCLLSGFVHLNSALLNKPSRFRITLGCTGDCYHLRKFHPITFPRYFHSRNLIGQLFAAENSFEFISCL